MKHQKNILTAVETLAQVRSVNHLIQGLCSRITISELNASEAQGLWTVLEWQNQHVASVEGLFKTVGDYSRCG